ncbi:MAG: hypothetical protein ACFFA6_11185 [Promethearchaeota archaeon]
MKKIKVLSIISCCILMSLFIYNLYTDQNTTELSIVSSIDNHDIHTSSVETFTKQWLKNSDFSTQESWESQIIGDNRDAVTTISEGYGNYKLIGDSEVVRIDEPLNDTDWTAFKNGDKIEPDDYGISSAGCWLTHTWDESVDQTRNNPSIQWKRNITMPINMSDYIITDVSLEIIFNATVTAKGSNPLAPQVDGIERTGDYTDGDIDPPPGGYPEPPQFGVGDLATFYAYFSDVDGSFFYPVAKNKTTDLGRDDPEVNNYTDTAMKIAPEYLLKSYLTSALETDNYNFTITLGIDISSEDNDYNVDIDVWDLLIIRSLNLTITYEKRIDILTSISWSQVGDTIQGGKTRITDANLNFSYSINQTWPADLAPNTEMRVLINDNPYSPPKTDYLKLSTFTIGFKEAKINGSDFTSLFQKNVNITLSIQVFLLDTFELDQNITILIDDVYLEITYIVVTLELFEEPWLFMLLLIIASILAACIGAYLIAYYKVLRYPRPVRKVRKYRKTLRKKDAPSTPIIARERAFKGAYKHELSAVASLAKVSPAVQKTIPDKLKTKTTPTTEPKSKALGEKIEQDELIAKSLEKKEELDELVKKAVDK